ncbi:hypothetical protein CTAYLR_002132 [Chrysophaeum taylorii]|uniref:Uncharacterized protein n=1 Tax=Chrysophaeum taylorii TaxID=2483200 RepID=A0AAD7XR86_9STRA|nr:hypothetical protein CTAYLR_002132 [Chrysophaeum taylorii]
MALADACRRRIRQFGAQALANTARASFARRARRGTSALRGAIAGVAPSRLDEFNSQELANTSWAFATARIEELANTAWGFTTPGVEAPQLFAAIAGAGSSRLGEFNPQNLANTAWAFACVDWKKDPKFFTELAYFAVANLDALDYRGQSQLHLASLHFGHEWPNRSSPLSKHQQMLQVAYQRQDPRPSQLQRDVATALDRVGWMHVFEHVTEEGLSLDMAQPADTKRARSKSTGHTTTSRERGLRTGLRASSPDCYGGLAGT